MKLLSLRQLRENAFETWNRFPFAILSAAIGTVAAVIILQRDLHILFGDHRLENLSAVAFLGISVFTSVQLLAETKRWSFYLSLGVKLGAACLLIVYYALLPRDIFESATVHLIRFFLFAIATHLFVAIAFFTERGHIDAFWEFNKSLFLRFVTAGLYSSVLYIGLAIALLAIDQLFTVKILPERYGQLWLCITGIFNTWFFLSGIPHRTELSDEQIRYPRGLKVFTQYVMIPLVAVYLCILYAYLGKIIFEWDWPKGWVGNLVLGFSTTGIFSLLLIHPIKDRTENSWMAVIWRWFYVVILPLVVLLLLAVWRRTTEYGITEKRYFVIVLGFWLAAIAIYFLLSKTKSIKLIPISLCAIAVLVSFGPWGAFSVSERNQVHRLEQILTNNKLLVNGKAQKGTFEISFTDAKHISGIVRYLAETHSVDVLQPWFAEPLDSLVPADQNQSRWYRRQADAKRIVRLFGVRYVDEWEQSEGESRIRRYRFRSDTLKVFPLKEYRYLIRNMIFNEREKAATIHLDHERWDILLNADSARIEFVPSADAAASFSLDLRERLAVLRSRYGIIEYSDNQVPQDMMTFSVERSTVRMQIFLESITVDATMKHIIPATVTMDILMDTGVQ
jgi:hypothetical protein